MKREQIERVTHAWYVGSFVGFAKLPPLADVLRPLLPREPVRQLDEDELMHRMDLWRVAMAPRATI